MDAALGDRYHLIREIGAGGMGRVFQAVDLRTGRAVAAKLLIAGDEIDLQSLLRFQQEGAVLSTLKHPNIVQVFSTFLEENTSCIIMELLEGQSLGQVLRDDELSPARIKHVMQQVASALSYAHSRGIVHRDVKPDNIMVVGDDHVKVTDFGIARVLQEGNTLLSKTGMAIGTPLYMAPEQIEGAKVDGRTDIYSFGAVLYQLVAGRPPFEGDDPLTIAFKHVHKAPAPPSQVRANVPEDWEELILRALAKNPANRFQTVAALEEAVASLTIDWQPSVERTQQLAPPELQSEERDTEALEREARSQLDEGRSKERSGDLRAALADYRTALTVAPPGPLRAELESAIDRLRARMESRTTPRSASRLPRRWLAAGSATSALLLAAIVLSIILLHGSSKTKPLAAHPRAGVPAAWGVRGIGIGQFLGPTGVAADKDGYVYVADTPNNRIEKFSPTGQYITAYGSSGASSNPGGFSLPGAVAVDSRGNLYVADTGNNRIQKLSPSGEVLAVWGRRGTAPGQFEGPNGVALDAHGNVYVADTDNYRIQKLSTSGRPLTTWGKRPASRQLQTWVRKGAPPGGFNFPVAIAVDARGTVYVADGGAKGRIQKLSAGGRVLAVWTEYGSSRSRFENVGGLSIDSQGNVYVTDSGNDRALELSPGGTLIGQWGTKGSGLGQFQAPWGVAAARNGAVYVADTDNYRIQRLSPSGTPGAIWGKFGAGPGQFHTPAGLGLDVPGNTYVADALNDRVQKLSPAGRFLAQWKTIGFQPGQGFEPADVAVDAAGNLYVPSALLNTIEKLSPTGKPLAYWGKEGSAPGEYNYPDSVALDAQGNLYISDGLNNRIQKISPDGKPLAQWGTRGTGPGQFNIPAGIALDAQGNIFVADFGNDRIQKLSPAGRPLTQWGTTGSGPGQFKSPGGVAVDAQGNIYVADILNHRIQKFSSTLHFLAWWNIKATGSGGASEINDLVVDGEGNLYVLDFKQNHIEKFFAPESIAGIIGSQTRASHVSGSAGKSSHAIHGTVLCAPNGASEETMNAVLRVVERRLNHGFGDSRGRVERQGNTCIVVASDSTTSSLPILAALAEPGYMALTNGGTAELAPGRHVALSCKKLGPNCPPGSKIGPTNLRAKPYPIVQIVLPGTEVKPGSAQLGYDTAGHAIVTYVLAEKGTGLWCSFTSSHVGKYSALVLDNRVVSDPTIQEAICSGQAEISGLSGTREAREIAAYLNYGALPVALHVSGTQ